MAGWIGSAVHAGTGTSLSSVLGSASSFLGPVGSILSGVSSIFGGGRGGQSSTEKLSNKIAHDSFYYPFTYRLADARRNKIHPLFALGANPSFSSPTIAGQSDTGSQLGDALRDVAEGLKGVDRAKMAKEAHEAELFGRRAQTYKDIQEGQRAGAESHLANTQASLVQQQILDSEVARAAQGRQARKDLPPLYIRVKNPVSGEVVWLPNPDLNIEMGESIGTSYWLRGKEYDTRGKPAVPAGSFSDVSP